MNTGITSCRKLIGGSAAGSVTVTGTVNVFPSAVTVIFALPLPTGFTHPASTVATFGLSVANVAVSRRSSA